MAETKTAKGKGTAQQQTFTSCCPTPGTVAMPDHSPPTAQPPVGSPRVERVRGDSTRRAGLVAGLQE